MLNPDFWNQIAPSIFKAAVGLVVTGLLGVVMWPFRKAHKEWIALKDEVTATRTELTQQRTNCLSTLQTQGEEQIKLLSKTVEVLEGTRLDIAQQTGYLSAIAAQPARRRAV